MFYVIVIFVYEIFLSLCSNSVCYNIVSSYSSDVGHVLIPMEMKSNHKCSLQIHAGLKRVNARYELMALKRSTCDRITQDGW